MAIERPVKLYDFGAVQVAPAHEIDRQFDQHKRSLDAVIKQLNALEASIGGLTNTVAATRAVTPVSRLARSAPTGVLGPNVGGPWATDDAGAAATAADYSQVCIDWAEHMPDTVPPNTLAINAVTGDHWSSRWWANRAAAIVSVLGQSSTGIIAEPVAVTAPNTFALLSNTPADSGNTMEVIVNGRVFSGCATPAPFYVSGKQIVWSSTLYGVVPGDEVIARYRFAVGAAIPMTGKAVSLYYVATQGQSSFPLDVPDRFSFSYHLTTSSTVQVSRNGQRLMPDDGSGKGGFTVASNAVNLLWPAGVDETIVVDVWEQDSVGPPGPPGPPGPAYGGPLIPNAVGDGVANDGAAIQNALNASKDVYLPPGVYLINDHILTPQSGARISGPGVLFKTTWAGVDDAFFFLDGKDDVIIDGVQARYPNTGFCYFVYARNSTRIKITRCVGGSASEPWYNGTLIFIGKNCVDAEVSFNLLYGGLAGVATGGDPWQGGSSTVDGTVDGCDILYNAIFSTKDEMIDVNWDTNNFRVIGNHGKQIGTRGDATNEAIDIGGSVDGTGSTCRNGEVAFNFVQIASTLGNAPGNQVQSTGVHLKLWTSNVEVHHNHLLGPATQGGLNGVYFDASSSRCVAHHNLIDTFQTGVSFTGVSGCHAHHNTLFSTQGYVGDSGVKFSTATGSSADDNVIEGFAKGVYYTVAATRAHARRNNILNATQSGVIFSSGTFLDCFTPGNHMLGLAATGSGIDIATLTGGDVSDCWVRGGFALNGVYVRADSSIIKAHNLRIEACNVGFAAYGPFVDIVGGLFKGCVSYGLDANAADIRVTGLRCQDNNTAATATYNVRFQATCARLHVNGLVSDAVGSRGVQFLGGDNCYVAGVHAPRFLTTAVGGLNLLTNSVISDVGASASQNVTMASNAVTAQNGCKQLIVDTSGPASEALNTITYTGKAGDTMRVRSLSNARTPVVTDSANLNLAGNAAFTLANTLQSIFLCWNGASWDEVARSTN